MTKTANPSATKLQLKYTWEGGEGNETQITLEFFPKGPTGNETELVLTHEGFSTKEFRDKHEEGWNGCLTKLSTFLK